MSPQEQRAFEQAIEAAAASGNVQAALELSQAAESAMRAVGVEPPAKFQIPTLRQSVKTEAESRAPWEQVLSGVGSAAVRAGEGLKAIAPNPGVVPMRGMYTNEPPLQVVPGGPELNKARVADWTAVRDATPYTQGGNIGGNLGMAAVAPAAAGSTIARAAGVSPGILGSRMGMTADTMLTAGAVNAAMEPGTVQERAKAGITAALMAGVPTAAMGASQGARRMTTRAGKQISVGEGLRRELGDDVADTLAAKLAAGEDDVARVLGTRPSASQLTENPTLQTLESGSRTNRGDLWRPFDQANAQARWDALQGRAGTPEALEQMRLSRDQLTAPMREQALTKASQAIRSNLGDTAEVSAPIRQLIDRLQTGDMRPNQQVQTMVSFVQKEQNKGATPGQIYQIRKQLTDGIANAPTSELSQAARSARPQRMELIKSLDDALDNLSGGQWSKYMQTYAAESPPITSMTAMQKIVQALERGQETGRVPTLMGGGDSPAWKTMGNLRDRFGEKMFGNKTIDQFVPEDRAIVDALVASLKRQSEGMGGAKATLGSHTAPLIAAANRSDAVARTLANGAAGSAMPMVGGILTSKLFDSMGRKAEEELARVLQDPRLLAQAMERAKNARMLMESSQRVGAAAGRGYATNPD